MTQIGGKLILRNFRGFATLLGEESLNDWTVLSLRTRDDTQSYRAESRRADGSSSVAGRALLVGREKRVPSNYPINKYEIPYDAVVVLCPARGDSYLRTNSSVYSVIRIQFGVSGVFYGPFTAISVLP